MPLAALVRRYALLLLALLWSTSALARSETYEGNLTPRGGESSISIVLQMEDLGGFLTGNVKVGSPLNRDAPINNGRNVAGSCNLSTVLSNNLTLRLHGDCGATMFEGIYQIFSKEPKSVATGTFRLTRKVNLSNKGKDVDGFAPPAMTISGCIKTNTRCLAGCPRGDTDIEYLCANRCRTKLQTCKTQVAKQAVSEEPQ
jgi:hypothetical protein